ncbi:MAG: hypothetical protein RLZZ618_820 [Pseudomonadota bacterium]|jgi:hypothetical protein
MRSSDQGTGPPKELAQLLRLRKVRVDAAQTAVQMQRVECDKAAAAVQQRLVKIQEGRQNVRQLASYTVGQGASDIPRLVACFTAFREKLNDALERNEYALMDDEHDLESSQALLREKRQAWMREQSRRDGVEEALVRSRRALVLKSDIQTDNEADELGRSAPLAVQVSPPSAKTS